ncbi:MAG: adenosine deaminase family protein, partial [Nitriliruptorales bacterium]|nr:adenosine deaminase family protein [Nitriliruptorales bacterium]
LHQERGLAHDEIVEAVLAGLGEGADATGLTVRLLLDALRNQDDSREIAELAVRWRDRGVVGFDISGPEAGYPPSEHLEAFQYVKRENFHITIHAGEGYGLPSIWEAVQYCGAERLGHGVRIVEDIETTADGDHELGALAAFVRDRRIALELCPTSNVHTAAVPSLEEHPFDLLAELGFRVTVNTDNRLMSGVTMTSEFGALADAFGYGLDDFERFTINAMKSAFIPFPDRVRMIEEVILPGYADLRDGGAA